jgi:hypothetical protein
VLTSKYHFIVFIPVGNIAPLHASSRELEASTVQNNSVPGRHTPLSESNWQRQQFRLFRVQVTVTELGRCHIVLTLCAVTPHQNRLTNYSTDPVKVLSRSFSRYCHSNFFWLMQRVLCTLYCTKVRRDVKK